MLLLRSRLLPFKHPATTYTYTISLHDALPIYQTIDYGDLANEIHRIITGPPVELIETLAQSIANSALKFTGIQAVDVAVSDRKSTRLNSSHVARSYAVFCLKKKK